MAKAPPRYTSRSRKSQRKYRRLPVPRDLNSTTNQYVSGKTFPVSLMSELKWGHSSTHNQVSLSAYSFRIRANSVFDPDYSTSAGQTSAYGLDIFAGAYSKYEVKAITIDVRMAPLAASQVCTGGICFLAENDSAPSDPSVLAARSLTGTNQTFSIYRPYIFKRRYRLAELNNILPALRQSSTSSNPPNREILSVTVYNPESTTVEIWKTIKVIYHVQFTDRRQITASNV